ncbi:MAG TPA: c-type cytochrome [Candidatus Binatia bacterium]|nr:c-type cytochrome [Candidatus Binatia bacterium]
MTQRSKIGLAIVLLVAAGAATAFWLLLQHGFSARDQPTAIEAFVARRLRHLAVPRSARQAKNPIPATPEVLAEARAHFADHCASCHGNDGSGQTEMGQRLYPKAPDMRQADTQLLSDGELFYIIHNGIRLTGMPAWGDSPPEEDQDSWKLVHFIRHLPEISPEELEEMKKLNPKSPQEMEEEEEEQKFLQGEDSPSPSPQHHH